MKTLKKLIYLLLLLPLVSTAQDNGSTLLNLTEITVKPGHDAQFNEGVKLWKACYLENNGADHWNFWHRLQGKGNVYVLAGSMAKWADMDKEDAANDACRMTLINFIMPHVESVEYNIARSMPELSREPMEGTKLIWVTFFEVNNTNDFNEVIKGISSAIKTVEGKNRGYWYTILGGAPETPDYYITAPFKGFADLDNDSDGVWKVYEKVHGKKATTALQAKSRSAIDSIWSYIFTLSEDLSF